MSDIQLFFSQFHLLRPECLLLFIPLAAIIWGIKRRQALSGQWQNVIAPQLQKYVLKQQSHQKQTSWEHHLLIMAAVLGILALSGPSWQKQASPVYNNQAGLVIALDLSLSMTAQDVSPSRLQRAKFKITDILQQHSDKNVALIVFAGDAHAVSPLTRDSKTIQAMLPALDPYIMPAQGSNYVAMAQQAINLFEQGNSQPRQLLIISDGIEQTDIQSASELLKSANVYVSLLALGTEQGAPIVKPDGRFFKDSQGQVIMPPLEWDNLTSFSQASGARIHQLSSNDRDINYLLPNLNTQQNFEESEEEASFDQWLDSGYWLLLPMLFLTLGAFRKGAILVLICGISLSTENSWANEPSNTSSHWNLPDFLLNQDQQGAKYFNHKPKYASELFDDEKWKASSLYKAGEYEAALDIWKKHSDSQSLYNQGNALAKLNKLDDAIAAYDQALSQNPDFEDAKFNKALLEQLKQNADENQNQQGSDNQNQQNSDQQQDSQQKNQNQQSSDQQQNSSDQQQSDQQKQQDSSSTNNQNEQQSQNPNQQAQTEEEKKKEQEMQALKDAQKQKQAEQEQQQSKDEQQNSEQQQARMTEQERQQDSEQKQAMQQWIERIPDDPGGLLRNKFLYQYKNRNQESNNGERKPW